MLSYQYDGSQIDKTRKITPIEAVRVASLPESYATWTRMFGEEESFQSDSHLLECVAMGVPQRSSVAIDEAIHDVLVRAGVPFDVHEERLPSAQAHLARKKCSAIDSYLRSWVGLPNKVRSMTLDTGANHTFLYTDVEPFMSNMSKSRARIGVANKSSMSASMTGSLHTYVLNLAAASGVEPISSFDIPSATTVPELSKELLSVDDFFRFHKYNLILRQPDYEDGVSELYRPAAPGRPESRIPLLYDYASGGWKMFYVPSKGLGKQDMEVLCKYMQDYLEHNTPESAAALEASLMSYEQAVALHTSLQAHPAVDHVVDCQWGDHQIRQTDVEEDPQDHKLHDKNDLCPSDKPDSDQQKRRRVDVIEVPKAC